MEEISTLKGIVEFALEKEAEAEGFYQNLAKQIKSERATTIFDELAAEEHKHYEALTNLDVSILDKVSIKNIPDLKISDYLHEVTYAPDMTYQDILVLAMKNEEHSHALYQGLAKNTDDDELKKIFEFLAMQEARHKLRLETEYDEYVLTED